MACTTRVLHVIDNLSPGGAERVLVELVASLARRNVSVGVCVTRNDLQLASELPTTVPVLVLGRTRTWDWSAIVRLANYCRTHKVGLLHAHMRGSLNICGLVKLLRGNNVKLLFHDHFGDLAADKAVPLSLQVIGHSLLDKYVCVDSALRLWAVESVGLKREATCVLENAIDTSRFVNVNKSDRLHWGKIDQPIVAAVVANLRPQKDHPLLLKAMAMSKKLKQKLHVLLIGHNHEDDYSKLCHQLVQELGLEGNVTFVGKRNDIPEILARVDLGLLCSRCESGPVTLLEYMASGLPFVATRTGSIAINLEELGLASFVNPGDSHNLSRALEEIVDLPKRQREIRGQIGQKIVQEFFNVKMQVERLIEIYRELGVKDIEQPNQLCRYARIPSE